MKLKSKVEEAVTDLKRRKHIINGAEAKNLIQNFRDKYTSLIPKELMAIDKEYGVIPHSETFNVASIRMLIDQPGCEFFRICTGLNEKNQIVYVLKGLKGNLEDIGGVSSNGITAKGLDAEIILDDSQRVPPWDLNNE